MIAPTMLDEGSRVSLPDPDDRAASELEAFMSDVADGTIVNVPWPGTNLTEYTQALLPGCLTVMMGDPGVGKTFWVLQCMVAWYLAGHDPAVFFIEKDRRFHTQRLLAQLEGSGNFTDVGWLGTEEGAKATKEAMQRHHKIIAEIGRSIWSQPHSRVTLGMVLTWIRERAEAGNRVIVVDPITAAAAGESRWTKDEAFVDAVQQIATRRAVSVVLMSHAKKGYQGDGKFGGAASGHEGAGGAAYHRFSDTGIWIKRPAKPRNVQYQTPHGPSAATIDIFFQIYKARNGKRQGVELAYLFREMKFAEQGIVLKEIKGGDVASDDNSPLPMTPAQAAELAKMAAKLFPGQFTHEAAKLWASELMGYSYQKAMRAIEDHKTKHERASLPSLLSELGSAPQRDWDEPT